MVSKTRLLWSACSIALPFLLAGCGGGNGAGTKTPDSVAQPDFSVIMSSSVTVTPNSTQTISISVAGENGFSSAVNMLLSGLPAAVTAAPATFTLDPDASQAVGGRTTTSDTSSAFSQTVVITAGNNAVPGAVPLSVTATSGSITHTAVTSTKQADFALAGPATKVALTAGATAQISVSADAFNGFSGQVAATLAGLPSGVTASLSSLTLTPGTAQTITLTAAPSAASGSATLTLLGTSGTLSHNFEFSLALNPQVAAPDFALTATPNNLTLQAGGAAQSFAVSATAINGFAGPVSLLLNNLPAGVSGPSSAVTVQPGTPVMLALTATPGAAAGTAPITLAGTAGALLHTVPLTLTITPAADFSVHLNPTTLTLTPGGSAAQVTFTMSAENGFTGSASVTVSGLPSGVAAQPSSFVLSPGGSQAISFSAASTDQAQTANITLTAASSEVTHTATLPLTITQPSPGFNLQVSPGSLTLTQGGPSQTLSITANATNGFSSPVNLAFSGSANITVSPNPVALTPGIAQTVNVSAAANATAGANTIIVTGSSGSITQTSSVPVTVNSAGPDFTLSVYPSVMNLAPGNLQLGLVPPPQPLEIVATPLNGFSDPIAVTFSGLPAAVPGPGGTIPLAPGIPRQTQLVENAGATAGSAVVTVTATSATVTHTAQFTLNTSDTAGRDFSLFAIPTALLLTPGQTSLAIYPESSNAFANQISTEFTGLPAGVSANPSSPVLTISAPQVVTITVPPGTAPGSGVLAIVGTAGALTHETDVPYSVVANPGIRQYVGPATLTLNQGSTENLLLGAETTLEGSITTTANALPAGVTSPLFSPGGGFSYSGSLIQGLSVPLSGCGQCARRPKHTHVHLDRRYQHYGLPGAVECGQPAELHPECALRRNRIPRADGHLQPGSKRDQWV
jgi:hypothetical protein